MGFALVIQKAESRVGTDEDLKLSDLLRYYERDSKAALVSCTDTCTLAHTLFTFKHDYVRICCIAGQGALPILSQQTRNWNKQEQRTKVFRR